MPSHFPRRLTAEQVTTGDLVASARTMIRPGRRTVLGITGPPGSGKSTLAAAIASELEPDVVTVPMDGFHLSDDVLEAMGARARKGAPDTFDVAGFVTLVRRIRQDDQTVYAPRFCRAMECAIAGAVPVPPATSLVIVEGLYLLLDQPGWSEIRQSLDEIWYLDTGPDVARARLVERRLLAAETAEQAAAWADGPDAEHGRIVRQTASGADRLLSVAVSGEPRGGRKNSGSRGGLAPVAPSGAHLRWLSAESGRLLDFAGAAVLPDGGFAELDSGGGTSPASARLLIVTCRMTYSFALASQWRRPGAAGIAAGGIQALSGFRDAEDGGWFSRVCLDQPQRPGQVWDSAKSAYDHAFVVLAAAAAKIARVPGADALLAESVDIVKNRFLVDGMVIDSLGRAWDRVSGYRGANSSMHMVEALLAAADAAGDRSWAEVAAGIATRITAVARDHGWRVPEHYDEQWRPDLAFNRDAPMDIFKPYGSAPGHGFEWARLCAALAAAFPGDRDRWLETAGQLYRRADADGWDRPRGGCYYTVDWRGRPCVRRRLHWVMTEAISASAALFRATGDISYGRDYRRFWEWTSRYLIDVMDGSWHHELDEQLHPDQLMFAGKPDTYHALQATLAMRVFPAQSVPGGLRAHLGTPPPRSRDQRIVEAMGGQ